MSEDLSLEIALMSSLFGLEPRLPYSDHRGWFAVGFGNHESNSSKRGKYLAVKYNGLWFIGKNDFEHFVFEMEPFNHFEEAIKLIPKLLEGSEE